MSEPAPTPPASALIFVGSWSDSQSVLLPESVDASRIADLYWLLAIGALAILAIVAIIAVLAMAGPPAVRTALGDERLVVVGGIAFPCVALGALLIYGFTVMVGAAPATNDPRALRIKVEGERWWWRIIYTRPDGTSFETANEIRIPVGRPVALSLVSDNVIHSFWVPRLAGKVDMIPGRTNRLTFVAERPGRYRGQCAEYCGGAHALMAFVVEALAPDDFERWLAAEGGDAAQPGAGPATEGRALFIENGCGGCHRVRGTTAVGVVGPDLTHVGSRLTLGAATLTNTPAEMARWIRDHRRIKPQNLMLPYHNLSTTEVFAIAAYLSGSR